MKSTPEDLRRRLRQVRRELSYWKSREHTYRSSVRSKPLKLIAERKTKGLFKEELELLDSLGELDPVVTYLPPGVQTTKLDGRSGTGFMRRYPKPEKPSDVES